MSICSSYRSSAQQRVSRLACYSPAMEAPLAHQLSRLCPVVRRSSRGLLNCEDGSASVRNLPR